MYGRWQKMDASILLRERPKHETWSKRETFSEQRCSIRIAAEGSSLVLIIAHRGASGNAPENTLAAFRKAVALGATFSETDLQLSRDARFVAIHDATVNRTTNGQGAVHDMTLAELRKLDAGSWFGS